VNFMKLGGRWFKGITFVLLVLLTFTLVGCKKKKKVISLKRVFYKEEGGFVVKRGRLSKAWKLNNEGVKFAKENKLDKAMGKFIEAYADKQSSAFLINQANVLRLKGKVDDALKLLARAEAQSDYSLFKKYAEELRRVLTANTVSTVEVELLSKPPEPQHDERLHAEVEKLWQDGKIDDVLLLLEGYGIDRLDGELKVFYAYYSFGRRSKAPNDDVNALWRQISKDKIAFLSRYDWEWAKLEYYVNLYFKGEIDANQFLSAVGDDAPFKLFRKIQVCLREGRKEEAKSFYEILKKNFPSSQYVSKLKVFLEESEENVLAKAYSMMKKHPEEALEMVRSLKPEPLTWSVVMATCAVRVGDVYEGLANYLRVALLVKGKLGQAKIIKKLNMQAVGTEGVYIDQINKLLAGEMDHLEFPDDLQGFIIEYFKSNKWWEELIKLSHYMPMDVCTLGEAYLRVGKWAKAAQNLKDCPDKRAEAALCYEKIGKLEEAKRLYEEEFENGNVDAGLKLVGIYEKLKDFDKERALIRRLLTMNITSEQKKGLKAKLLQLEADDFVLY